MTDKTDEAVAWILRADTGTVRLWTQDRGFAEQKAGDWEAATEPIFPASSLASRDARIAELEGLLGRVINSSYAAECQECAVVANGSALRSEIENLLSTKDQDQ
jgi:hypothetical protein